MRKFRRTVAVDEPRSTGRAKPLAVAASTMLAAAVLVCPAAATASNFSPIGCKQIRRGVKQCPTVNYTFQTLDNAADTTFNQLLGINKNGVIAGYFGSGVPVGNQGHPNKGYLLFPDYNQNFYADNNFPGSVQTQVTGLNDSGVFVGFWSSMNNPMVGDAAPVNDNHGFYRLGGQFTSTDFPATNPATPPVDQLLGVNNRKVAVGFYNDADGNGHGFTYDIPSNSYTPLNVPNATSATATGINDNGDIVGFATFNGATQGFIKTAASGGAVAALSYPGASSTQLLGINNSGEAVGVATIGTGSSAQLHGITWAAGIGFRQVDAPNGQGTTTINGVDACGDLVGFYVSGDNTHGLLANASFSKFLSQVPGGMARDAATTAKKKTKKPKRIKTKLPNGC